MNNKYVGMLALWAVATVGTACAEVLEVSGATTVQRRVLEPGAEPLRAATGIELKIMGPGTGKGMLALFDDRVPVAAAGEALDDAVASAKAVGAEAGRPEKVHVVTGAVIPRPLGFVTVGAPAPAAQKMIDYFRSPEGQKQIR